MSKIYVGSRLKQLRRERDLSQATLAHELGLSPSYVNQIEHDVRPLTVAVLTRITDTFGVDATFFSRDDSSRLLAEVQDVLHDQEVTSSPTEMQELSDFVSLHPAIAQTLVEMHRRYRNISDKLALATEQRRAEQGLRGDTAPRDGSMPHEEVRDFFYSRRNYLDRLDRLAEELAARIEVAPYRIRATEAALATRLSEDHGITIVTSPAPQDLLHRLDKDSATLTLAAQLTPGQRAFRMAAELGQLAAPRLFQELIDSEPLTSQASRDLARRGIASYFAAAVLMPYRRFHRSAEQAGYDVEFLCQAYGVGYETVASRLSTLQRPHLRGVPFTFIRVDRAGNVSKRQSATGFHLTQSGGTCPLWNVYETFTRPGQVLRQFAQMPDGRSYLWISRTVRQPGERFGSPDKEFAIGLGCEARHAARTVYAAGFDFTDVAAADPIGTGCRVCSRVGCRQRAFPSIFENLEVDPHRTAIAPY